MFAVATIASGVATATPIWWMGSSMVGPSGEALNTSTWTIWMYESASSTTLPALINPDGSTSQGDAWKSTVLTHASTASSFFSTVYDNSAIGLSGSDYAFSVIFNTTTYGEVSTATKYAVIDNAPFDVPTPGAQDPYFIYNAGGTTQSDWKTLVPEPTTMALLGVGILTLAARRRK